MSQRRAVLATAWRVAVVTVTAFAALAAGFAVSGQLGLVITADCLAALALLAALARTPGGVRERDVLRPVAAWARGAWQRIWPRRAAPAAAVQPSDFPAYAKISSDLGWASVSQWHYDHGLRPLLSRLFESVLEERHRVDLTTDPERARSVVGDDVWPLIDPSRPPSFDSRAPGTDVRTLTRIVDRLEQL
jgi:hypothetical protein